MKEVNRLIEFIISLDGTGNKDAVKHQSLTALSIALFSIF